MTRDTDARLRSDARARELGNPNGLACGRARYSQDEPARELGCTTAIAAMIYGGLLAYLVWRVML